MSKWYKNPEIIKWLLVIVITIAFGIFIFVSSLIPDNLVIGLTVIDYIVFIYANFKINVIIKREREKANQVNVNRAARRQAARLKTNR